MVTSDSWHVRQAAHSHYRAFDQLTELHRLTEAWITELQVSRPSHKMDRGLPREITENLWMLESPDDRGLDALLDDTTPGDVLARLEKTVWAVQAYTLAQLIERTKAGDRAVLESTLQQICWKLGRERAEKVWKNLSDEMRGNLKQLHLALADTPFGAPGNTPAFLVERGTHDEVRLELLHCAHQSAYSEVRRLSDELCALHGHWIRGFAYGLNPRVEIEISLAAGKNSRCCQRWYFANPV